MAVPSNYAALVTAIDAILTTYGLSLFQVFGGRSTQPSLRELISLRWKLFSMTTPANYATLIAEIDVVIESYGLSLQEVFGGRSTQPTLQELIDLRYELFEVDGGASDPSQITSATVPLTRADGSALVAQDIWNDTSSGLRWIYSGAVWRSAEVQFLPLTLVSAAGHNALPNNPTLATHIYFESYKVAQQSANMGTNNASNYINIRLLFREKATATEVQISNVQNYPLATNTANTWTNLINTAYLISTYSGLVVRELAGAGTNYAYANYTPIVTFRWQFS